MRTSKSLCFGLVAFVLLLAGGPARAVVGGTNASYVKPEDVHDDDQLELRPSIPCPDPVGVAVWRVSEPLLNLWVHDTPLRYRLSDGTWMELRLSYRSREEWTDRRVNIGGFGDRWECNWISVLESSNGSWVTNYVAGGGQVLFNTDTNKSEFRSGRKLVYAEDFPGINALRAGSGSVIESPLGGNNAYHLLWTAPNARAFQLRSESWDRRQRQAKYVWETANGVVRLARLVDWDGRECFLDYTHTNPALITAVTDPYGRAARFFYDVYGRLTNITDTAGMASRFIYDLDGKITEMQTPYGTNVVRYLRPLLTTNALYGSSSLDEAIEVTEADGSKQLFLYRAYGAISNGITVTNVSGEYANTDEANSYRDRNTYHWNRRQFQEISAQGLTNYFVMPPADYWKASLKHWLLQNLAGMTLLSDAASDAAGPVLDNTNGWRGGQTHFDYPNSPGPGFAGPIKRVSRTVENGISYSPGTSKQEDAVHNGWEQPTNVTQYLPSGYAVYRSDTDPNDSRRVLTVTGPNDIQLQSCGYDAVFTNLVRVATNALNEVTSFTYGDGARLAGVTFPGGLTAENFYYSSGATGFLAKTIAVGFSTNSFGYDKGNVVAHTNALGLVMEHTWDDLSRLTSTRFPDGTYVSNLWDKLDIGGARDRLGRWTRYGYNAVRQLVAVTNANGAVTEAQYCGCGSPSEIIRWNGTNALITQFHYNLAGQLTNIVAPDGYQIFYAYDVFGRATNVTDSAGRQLSFTHNENDQVTRLLGGTGTPRLLVANEYDVYGRLTSRTDRNGVTTAFDYDVLHRLKQRTLQNIWPYSVESFGYGSRGLTNHTDPLGQETFFAQDELGQVLFITNANLEVLGQTYNPLGQILTLTDGKGQITKWNYDLEGRVTNKVDAANNEIYRFQYDPNGQLTNRWQRGNITTTLRYDALGNLTNRTHTGGTSSTSPTTYAYDAFNRLTQMTDGLGTTVYSWSDADELLSEDGPWANDKITWTHTHRLRTGLALQQPALADWTQSYAYDEYSRLTNVTSPAGAFGAQYKTITSGYGDMAGNLVSRVNLPGGSYIENTQDDLGRLLSTVLKKSDTTPLNAHAYTYNPGHQRTNQTFTAGNYQNYIYDNIGQLKTATGWESDTVTPRLHEQHGYAYDKAWNLQHRTNNALLQTFATDNLNQLATINRSGTLTVAGNTTTPATGLDVNTQTASLYDDNAWAREGFPLVDGPTNFTAIAINSLGKQDTNTVTVDLRATNTFTYDMRGNLTSDGRHGLDYDDENQLIRVTRTNTFKKEFTYDGAFRLRIRQEFAWTNSAWLLTNETRFICDGLIPIQHRDGSNNPTLTLTRGNDLSGTVHGAGGIGGLLAMSTPKKHYFYHSDGSGNITALVNDHQNLMARRGYDPFGTTTFLDGPRHRDNPYWFSSELYDSETDYAHYPFRVYSPSLQRWLNRDPIGEAGGINLYGFVGNSPLSAVDPLGESWFTDRMRDVGTVVYDWMMGGAKVHDNGDSYIGARTRELGPTEDVLAATVPAATELAGVVGEEVAKQYVGGRIAGVGSGIVCKVMPHAAVMIRPGEKTGEEILSTLRSGDKLRKAAKERAILLPYGGPGGGHHLPAKSMFEGAAGYNLNQALAIPNAELARLGINHGLVSGAQQTLYRAFAKTGKTLTWEAVTKIEMQALVRGGMASGMAQATVQKAIQALKVAGVSGPTRIPWGK